MVNITSSKVLSDAEKQAILRLWEEYKKRHL